MSYKHSAFFQLPSEIMSLIYDFDGRYKSRFTIAMRELETKIEATMQYAEARQMLIQWANDEVPELNEIDFISHIHLSMRMQILCNKRSILSYCDCAQPCCYRFKTVNVLPTDRCMCHENVAIGGLTYISRFQGTRKEMHIRISQSGYCTKIVDPESQFHDISNSESYQTTEYTGEPWDW